MKLIKPSYEIWEQKPRNIIIPADMEIGPRMWKEELIQTIYRQIERVGRVCYKSEDKITEDSAKDFVKRMVKLGHGAMLEHGTVYLTIPVKSDCYEDNIEKFYLYYHNPYCKASHVGDWLYITTNYRVLVDNNWLRDLRYICEPTEYHEKRITVKFVCDRGVWNEFIRHKTLRRNDDDEWWAMVDYIMEQKCSFAQESQRYCNYSKDKFGNEVTFVIPKWCKSLQEGVLEYSIFEITEEESIFMDHLYTSEQNYFELLNLGWKPQQARLVLPNATKTELVMTGYTSDWKHFFELRDSAAAHPSAYELAHPLYNEFINRNYI